MTAPVVATVGGDAVTAADVDARERQVRAGGSAESLPRPGTGEARQLRRWLTQVLVAERVVARDAARLGSGDAVPTEDEVLPDAVARMEVGSVAAATLGGRAGRAMFAVVTATVRVSDDEVAAYHARNPMRFAPRERRPGGWDCGPARCGLEQVRPAVAAHLLAAARRREYRRWLDARCAELVELGPGYEHPGDPRQPDNTHRH